MFACPNWYPHEEGVNHCFCCGRFRTLMVLFSNTKMHREGETNFSGLGKHCQNKTSKPGADQVVSHICIWCIDSNIKQIMNLIQFSSSHLLAVTCIYSRLSAKSCWYMNLVPITDYSTRK